MYRKYRGIFDDDRADTCCRMSL